MRGLLIFAAILSTACQDRPDTFIVPLADLDAEMRLTDDDRFAYSPYMMRLVADQEPCLVLSPRDTRVSVDGRAGEMDPGEPRRRNDPCYGPAMMFDSVPSGLGPSTFEITDGSATWTFVMWQPFAYPGFTLESPTPIHMGDTVVLRLEQSIGSISDVSVNAYIDSPIDELFDLDEASGVTLTGNDVSFVWPVSETGMATLSVRATRHVRIDRCDAPRGCYDEAPQPAFERLEVELAP